MLERRRHYGAFSGLDPLPPAYGLVVGNCQAESLRVMLDSPALPLVRVPAVFELDADETRRLHELAAGASVLVSQPIRDGYRGLPLGTRELRAALPAGGRTVVVPIARFGGLHPFQAAIRVPGIDADPPLVAYHDVRTLGEAAGLRMRRALAPARIHDIARASIAELHRRERGLDVAVSDLYDPVRADLARTINHPGNALFVPLAARVAEAAGGALGPARDPGRPLLASVYAPLEEAVIEAWGLDDEPRPDWIVDGERLPAEAVRDAHAAWYAERPAFVAAALERLAPLVDAWRAA